MTDLYAELGVPKDADRAEIRAAYKRKAQKHHPDKVGGDDTAWKSIERAYAVLSDDSRRDRYDACGEDSATPPVEILARNYVLQNFMSLLQQEVEYSEVDLISTLKLQVEKDIGNVQRAENQARSKLNRLLKLQGKITCTRGDNMFETPLHTAIVTVEKALRDHVDSLEMLQTAATMLRPYHQSIGTLFQIDTTRNSSYFTYNP